MENKHRHVVIMSGLPGSGKSTWVNRQSGSKVIVSADDYFMTEGGEYNFDPRQLPQAHQQCFRLFLEVVQDKHPFDAIYVDNTNLKVFEIAPYYMAAEAYGCSVQIVRMECNRETCIDRNIHGVSAASMGRMWENMSSHRAYPPWWKVTFVQTDDLHESEVE